MQDKTTREPIKDFFAPMVGEWHSTNAPTFKIDTKGPPRIEYANGKSLTFPSRYETTFETKNKETGKIEKIGIFVPATFIETPVSAPAGGKRRRTRKNSNRRRGGSTKKNRKSHGRKHR